MFNIQFGALPVIDPLLAQMPTSWLHILAKPVIRFSPNGALNSENLESSTIRAMTALTSSFEM